MYAIVAYVGKGHLSHVVEALFYKEEQAERVSELMLRPDTPYYYESFRIPADWLDKDFTLYEAGHIFTRIADHLTYRERHGTIGS